MKVKGNAWFAAFTPSYLRQPGIQLPFVGETTSSAHRTKTLRHGSIAVRMAAARMKQARLSRAGVEKPDHLGWLL